jgi:hypothetical protein
MWNSCLSPEGVATLACVPIVFQNVVNAALMFSGVVAVGFIIWSGIKMINSGGDPKQVQGARQTLTYAIIGLIVILLSFFIVSLVSNIFGVSCIQQFGFDNCK